MELILVTDMRDPQCFGENISAETLPAWAEMDTERTKLNKTVRPPKF